MPPLTERQRDLVAGLDPAFQPWVLRHREAVLAAGIAWDITDGRRTIAEQADLKERKPILAAPPGSSKHELGFAYDGAGPRSDGEWAVFGNAAEGLGLKWGGRFSTREVWHVEAPQSRSDLAAWQLSVGALTAGAFIVAGVMLFKLSKGA